MIIGIVVFSVVLSFVIALVVVFNHPASGRRMSKERKVRIEASQNWHNGQFHNQIPTPQFTGDGNMLKAMWTMLTDKNSNRVPKEPLSAVKTDLFSLPQDSDWFVWFGHSSYLFQLGGKRFLIDPILSIKFPASLMLKPFPGTDIYSPADIPEIDYLIITHEHWDHLDYATLRELRGKVKHAVCPLGVADFLEYWGYDSSIIIEMDWEEAFESQSPETLRISCLPSRHFSNRLLDRNQTLWAAFMVEVGERKVYVGGDGGYDDRFKHVREQFGQIDLAIMENGQYNQNWAKIHLLPQGLEKAILDLQPKQVFTVHHDKFALSLHSWYEPDNVAHEIAERDSIVLLDKPIGTPVFF